MSSRLLPTLILAVVLPALALSIRQSLISNPYLEVGEVQIPLADLENARQEMAVGFPQFGKSTITWAILDGGYGPAWILHSRNSQLSAAALEQALKWKARLEQGEDFLDLAREQQQLLKHEDPMDYPGPPRPDHLGGRVCALVASMKEGEWAGPVRTLDGWELVFLDRRFDDESPDLRTRAGVQVCRIRCEVGDQWARDLALRDWELLPLDGTSETLALLPASFRNGRTKSN